MKVKTNWKCFGLFGYHRVKFQATYVILCGGFIISLSCSLSWEAYQQRVQQVITKIFIEFAFNHLELPGQDLPGLSQCTDKNWTKPIPDPLEKIRKIRFGRKSRVLGRRSVGICYSATAWVSISVPGPPSLEFRSEETAEQTSLGLFPSRSPQAYAKLPWLCNHNCINSFSRVLCHFDQFGRPCYTLHACRNFEFGTWGK